MTTKTTRKYPAPVYAAAGAGDLAYRTLRTIPAKVAELRSRTGAPEIDIQKLRGDVQKLRGDVQKLRGDVQNAARRNAAAFVAGVEAAQEKAVAIYTELVARGEQVVGGAKAPEAKVTQTALAPEAAPLAPEAALAAETAPLAAEAALAAETALAVEADVAPTAKTTATVKPVAKTTPAKATKSTRPAADR